MKVAHFYCYGGIGEGQGRVSAKKVSDWLAALPSDVTDIEVHINSYGGDVNHGYSIHDLFQNSGKHITTIAEGLVASIATVIFLSGTTRKITKNSQLMIHLPMVVVGGEEEEVVLNSGDLEEMKVNLKSQEARIEKFYSEKTGIPVNQIQNYLSNKDKYFDAEQAVELKFATEVSSGFRAVAEIKKEKTMSTEKKSKWDNFLAATRELFKAEGEPQVIEAASASAADGTVLYFTGTLAEGTQVFSDSEMSTPMADGSYVLENESTVTVKDGAVASVTEKAAMTASLEEQIATLKSENERLTAANTKMESEATETITEMKARLSKYKSEYVPKTSGTQMKAKETPLTKEEREQALREAEASNKKQ